MNRSGAAAHWRGSRLGTPKDDGEESFDVLFDTNKGARRSAKKGKNGEREEGWFWY